MTYVEKKTEKQLTKGEKALSVVVVVLLLIAGIALYLFLEERGRSKVVEAGKGVSEVVFSRTGAVIALEGEEEVEDVEIYDGTGSRIGNEAINKPSDTVVLDFDWNPNEKYRFDINLKDGSMLSSPGYAPLKPQPYELFSVDYSGEFPPEEEGHHGGVTQYAYAKGVVDISDDGKYCAVALIEGRVSIVDLETGQELWNKFIEDYNIGNMKLSDDGRYFVVGGSHTDAPVICFNTETGEEVWRYNTKQDLGAYDYAVTSGKTLVALEGNSHVWVASQFGWYETAGTRSYVTLPINESNIPKFRSQVYCFDITTGETVWTYPEGGDPDDDWGDGKIDKGITSMFVSEGSDQYLAVGLQSWMPQPSHTKDRALVLDAENGDLLWNWEIPVGAHCSHSINSGTTISPNGKYVAVGSDEGRMYFFDNQKCIDQGYGQAEWVRDLGSPRVIDGIVHHVGLPVPYFSNEELIVTVKYMYDGITFEDLPSTSLLHGYQFVLVYDTNGALKWDYYTGQSYSHTNGARQDVDTTSGYITVTRMHQWMSNYPVDKTSTTYSYMVPPEKNVPGVTVLDLNRESTESEDHVVWHLPVEGDCGGQADISSDGKYVAFVEGPVDIDPTGNNPNILGDYKLHVYV